MTAMNGTGMLLRLNLRLDRIQLPAWFLGFFILVWASVIAIKDAYPTPEALATRAQLLHNPAAVMMTGPLLATDDYTLGAALANELSLYVFLPAAIMSVLLVVRHTRAEEESGRLEMLRALPISRFAPASATVLTLVIANLLVAIAVTAGLIAAGAATTDSIAFGVATGLTGMVFGGVAAVTAQVSEFAGPARGTALGFIALAFVVRGIGDVIDPQGSWLSWLSPFAWAQQTRLYVDLRWWPLLISLGVAVLLFLIAAALNHRRDLGAGLRAGADGPAEAHRYLLSPAGLAWRLRRGGFIAWGVGLFLLAAAMGSLANELEPMVESTPDLASWVPLDVDSLTESFAAVILSFNMLAPAALMVGGVLAIRGEENAGRLEKVLLTGTSRTGFIAGWGAVITSLSILVTVVLGLGVGAGVSATTGDWAWLGETALASAAYLPVVLFFGGLSLALYGWAPRFTLLAWLLVAWSALVSFLGELLNLPDWARGISPLWHIPLVPEADVKVAPLLVLTGLAVVLALVGLAGFRRRDLADR